MAWRSSGTTNDEMVDNLKSKFRKRIRVRNSCCSRSHFLFSVRFPSLGFQVISSPEVEAGFRSVDRKLFVPKVSNRNWKILGAVDMLQRFDAKKSNVRMLYY